MYEIDDTPDPDEHEAWNIERERGMLSKEDRAFLLRDKSSGVGKNARDPDESRRATRYRIRKRIYNAILDFSLVYSHLSEKDRKLIFANQSRNPQDEMALWNSAIHTLAFLYERLTEEEDYQNFEYSLEAAVMEAIDKPGTLRRLSDDTVKNIEVDVDTSRVARLGDVGDKIRQEGWVSLTEEELETVETLVRSKSNDELHPETKEHLSKCVSKVRDMTEEEKEEYKEVQEKLGSAPGISIMGVADEVTSGDIAVDGIVIGDVILEIEEEDEE